MDLEKLSYIASFGSFILAVVALFLGTSAIKNVNKIKIAMKIDSIEKNTKKQNANNNVNSRINMKQ